MKYGKTIFIIIAILSTIFIIGEIGTYIYVEAPLSTDFYSSIPKKDVYKLQNHYGIKVVTGNNWIHLGWIANPDEEYYTIELKNVHGTVKKVGTTQFGSFLFHGKGATSG